MPRTEPHIDLVEFIRTHPRLLVLTGAGISTDSGIPDYRDQQGQWKVSVTASTPNTPH